MSDDEQRQYDVDVAADDYAAEQSFQAEMAAAAISPTTRRWIIVALAGIACLAIVAEVILSLRGDGTSEALLTVAATAVGGIAGMAIPGR